MKKSILLFILFIAVYTASLAVQIQTADIKKVAGNFYAAKSGLLQNSDQSTINPQIIYSRSEQGFVVYHVLGFDNHPGYVIVSADDRFTPIIGYSTTNNYTLSESGQPPAFISWMNSIAKDVLIAIHADAYTQEAVSNTWDMLLNHPMELTDNTTTTVGPLTTTTWGQGCNYNNSCPATGGVHPAGDCNHVLTGCVATAMSQVMKYWNFPPHGSGSHSYTDPANTNDPSYGVLSATFNANYAWSNMPDFPTNTATGINLLMSHAGVSVDMNYAFDVSGAWPYGSPVCANAFKTYFNYASAAVDIKKADYSLSAWDAIMIGELSSSRPICYGNNNHAWVIDGYNDNFNGTGNLYYHMNWGWNGGSNGYYLLADAGTNQEMIDNLYPTYMNPIAPTDVTATEGSFANKVRVTWRWASNASHYKVYRNTTNNSATATALSSWQTATTFDDLAAVPYVTYYYWVKSATSAAGANESGFSMNATGWIADPGTLTSDIALYTAVTPIYYEFSGNYYWNVVGVRPSGTDDWDISMYPSNDFTVFPSTSSTFGSGEVDFTVINGNTVTPATHGVRVSRYSGLNGAYTEFEGGTNILYEGANNNITWGVADIVKVWDVYLTPGIYGIQLLANSGAFDPGVAVYAPGGTGYFSRATATVQADNNGNGLSEATQINVATAGYYGIVVWSNNTSSGNFNLVIERPGTWTGAYDHNWHNTANWSGGIIPTASIDVTIPAVTNKPWVYAADAECNNLVVEAGVGNYLRIYDQTLTVNGNATINSQLMQDYAVPESKFIVMGNISWEPGSTAWASDQTTMQIYGNWSFKSGCNVQLNTGSVMFKGNEISYLYIDDADSYFNTLGSYKNDGASVWFSNASSAALGVMGDFYIHTTGQFVGNAYQNTVVGGSFYNNNILKCYAGSFIFAGAYQYITMHSGDFFNNLVIYPTNSVSLLTDVVCNGSLTISDGTLFAGNNTLYIGHDWNNQVGILGFNQETGTVEFNGGNYHQYCSDESFNNLIVNKTLGGAFRVDGSDVACESYDWTAGAVDVLSGSFTAYNLADNGISGSYYVNPGGTINLYNSGGYVDLNGNLFIYGGNFNVYGGTTDSWWPYTANASITMSGGILDFKNVGIYIYDNTLSFSQSITGGTIRSIGGFRADRPEFNPTAGAIEIYGPDNVTVQTTNSSNFNNFTLNKSGMAMFYADLYLNGNMNIIAGNLSSTGNDIYVKGNWSNFVGTGGYSEGNGTVWFTGTSPSILTTGETFYNLKLNKTWASSNGLLIASGTTTVVNNGLTILDGTIQTQDNTNLNTNGLTIQSGAGLYLAGNNSNLNITGNWTNANTYYSTTLGFNPGPLSTVTFNGSTDQLLMTDAVRETFNNLVINKSAGMFTTQDGIHCNMDFSMPMGTFNYGLIGLSHVFQGNFMVAPGTNWYNGNSTMTFSGNTTQNVTFSPTSGYFYEVFVTKPAGTSLNLLSNIISLNNGDLTLNSGTMNLNGYFYRCTGDVSVVTGRLSIPASSWLEVGSGRNLTIQNGGIIEAIGTAANNARITHHAGYYNFAIESGGTIAANNATFEYMGANGIYLQSGALVQTGNTFNNCTFREGQSGGTLLRIDNNQSFTVDNAYFPANSWAGSSNAYKSVNMGTVSFTNYTGDFAGEAFDNDAFDRLNWVGLVNLTGHLIYDNTLATPVSNTKVYLKSAGVTIDSTTTNASGYYIFPTISPGTFTLSAGCTKTWGGVNSTDALIIMRHFVHTLTLTGIRLAAADADGSGFINSVDALMTMKRFVNIISSFPSGDWVYTHPEVTIVGSPVVQDINTLCITDVDASYVPPAKRESGINLLEEGELLVTAGQHIDVPLNTLRNLEIGAISLELTIPESLQFEAATISQNPENLFYTIDGNRLLLAWSSLVPMNVKTGEAILSLRFNPLGLLNAPTALHFTAGAECELANAMAQVLHNETLSIPKLVTTLSNNALTAYEPYPNPFTEYCNIPLYLPETANVSISLKNLQGMEVERQEYTTLAQGEHLLKLWRENLAPGSYYAEIILNGTSSFRKFTKPLIITK